MDFGHHNQIRPRTVQNQSPLQEPQWNLAYLAAQGIPDPQTSPCSQSNTPSPSLFGTSPAGRYSPIPASASLGQHNKTTYRHRIYSGRYGRSSALPIHG